MALSFDGVSDIDTSSGRPWMQNVPGGTILGWAKVNLAGTQSMWGAFGNTGTTRAKLSITSTGQLSMRANALDADATSSFNSTGVIGRSIWAHVAAVFQFASKSGIAYINGVADTIGQFTNMTAGNTSNTACGLSRIGSNEPGSANAWNGQMEDVRIYNRALGPAEIMTIYTEKGKDGIWGGIQARWLMTEKGAGTLVDLPDVSSNGFGGAAGGTITYVSGIINTRRRLRAGVGHL